VVSRQKLGIILEKKQKDLDDFWHTKFTLIGFFCFLTTRHSALQNTIISFWVYWFLAKSLSTFCIPPFRNLITHVAIVTTHHQQQLSWNKSKGENWRLCGELPRLLFNHDIYPREIVCDLEFSKCKWTINDDLFLDEIEKSKKQGDL
jgi:hypothetical protein